MTIVTDGRRTVDAVVLRRMTARLAHRGPDDCGFARVDPVSGASEEWVDRPPAASLSGILIGHRRLSILDLSSAGHQPMFSEDRSAVIAFNGDIYNYVELREELRASGRTFRSHSDTEVLLKAYEVWGDAAFSRFNGMWAFVLWDGRRNRLLASRDRFGVKPLYWTFVDGAWIFASEVKAILDFPGAHRGFSQRNVQAYFEAGSVDVDATTFFAGIQAVPPGTALVMTDGRLACRRYWSLAMSEHTDARDSRDLAKQYRELLADSVRLRLRSDVPVATMLSGGLDSSSIAALVHLQRQALPERERREAELGLREFQHAITACWPGWAGDEENQVEILCRRFGLTLHKIYPTGDDLAEVMQEVVYFMDEPFESPTALVQYVLMRKARELGVKVVLNGHGSDEVLAGYPDRFVATYLASLLRERRLVQFASNCLGFLRTPGWTPGEVVRALWSDVRERGRNSPGLLARRTSDRRDGVVSADAAVVPPLLQDEGTIRALTRAGRLSAVQESGWRAFSRTILPKWLRMEDRVSMACSIESRLPFMDYRLVDFGFNLPDALKLRDGLTKFVLRQAMQDELPETVVGDRVKKRFAVPFEGWYQTAWRDLIGDSLLGDCALRSHVDFDPYQRELRKLLEGRPHRAGVSKVWRALNAEICLRTFSVVSHAPAGPE